MISGQWNWVLMEDVPETFAADDGSIHEQPVVGMIGPVLSVWIDDDPDPEADHRPYKAMTADGVIHTCDGKYKWIKASHEVDLIAWPDIV